MARFKVSDGFEKYLSALTGLEQNTTQILKQVIYEGAGNVADAVRAEIEAIPLGKTYVLNQIQKQGLLDGLGIAQIKSTLGQVNTKIGMDGYNHYHTKTFPNGQPNALIARSLISGTSFSQKYDFVGKAVNKSRKSAEEAMRSKVDDLIKKQMEE